LEELDERTIADALTDTEVVFRSTGFAEVTRTETVFCVAILGV
jgi:hypothetical protein